MKPNPKELQTLFPPKRIPADDDLSIHDAVQYDKMRILILNDLDGGRG